MKRVYLIFTLVFVLVLIGCASQQLVQKERGNKVLIVLRESGGSGGEVYYYTREAIMIPQMLEEAGFQAVMASASGRTFKNSVYS